MTIVILPAVFEVVCLPVRESRLYRYHCLVLHTARRCVADDHATCVYLSTVGLGPVRADSGSCRDVLHARLLYGLLLRFVCALTQWRRIYSQSLR